ncbi:MAG: hypothetical protein PHQ86_01920 [Dehalococcoidales bacterium]|nr:hypothetical protein [Dehalococcoidales bacterium]
MKFKSSWRVRKISEASQKAILPCGCDYNTLDKEHLLHCCPKHEII